MSYATSLSDIPRQVGSLYWTDSESDKPGDLPINSRQSSSWVVNLKAAQRWPCDPESFLLRADEVIE